MRTIYSSLILPHLSYCSTIWSGTSNFRLKRLQTLQNRAIRYIALAPSRSSAGPLFASLNLLKLNDMITSNIATFTFRCLKGVLPPNFDSFYMRNSLVHNYSTRQADHLRIEPYRIFKCCLSLKYRSVRIWNNLPI